MKAYETFPTDANLDFWIKNGLNVLMTGRHGIGKTHVILEAFNRNNLKYVYFSASTMDPWVDFIGIPKEKLDEKGSYLELIRPKNFRDDEVEAIFIDEFNRGHKKVKNALMELIQFKSINGKKYDNLKLIWIAINPDDDNSSKYDVEPMDEAQSDRFEIQIQLPFKPQMPYFIKKYGEELASGCVEWWNGLPEDVKNKISPRRLDTLLKIYKIGGNLKHVVPTESNVGKLVAILNHGSPIKRLKSLLSKTPLDEVELKKFVQDENNFSSTADMIADNFTVLNKLLDDEKIVSMVYTHAKVKKVIMGDPETYETILKNISSTSTNVAIAKEAKNALSELEKKRASGATTSGKSRKIKPSLKYKHKSLTSTKWEWNDPVLTLTVSRPLLFKKSHVTVNTVESAFYAVNSGTITSAMKSDALQTVYKAINDYIVGSHSLTDFHKCLSVIDYIAFSSNSAIFKNGIDRANMQNTINLAIKYIRGLDPSYTPEQFIKDYPNIVCNENITLESYASYYFTPALYTSKPVSPVYITPKTEEDPTKTTISWTSDKTSSTVHLPGGASVSVTASVS